MADPVDTDALRTRADALDNGLSQTPGMLRAAADEVDRLRKIETSRDHWLHNAAGLSGQLIRTEDERDRLRAVIESAPHSVDRCERVTYDGYDQTRPCTCWKADAL